MNDGIVNEMIACCGVDCAGKKTERLIELAMRYETAVLLLPEDNYAKTFFDFYEIKNRDAKTIPAPDGFYETLKEVCGDDVWQPIAEKTESLFGLPKRVAVFENDAAWKDELEGPDGLGPFFFIFGVMFCEYDGFTLCFISGSNN